MNPCSGRGVPFGVKIRSMEVVTMLGAKSYAQNIYF